jgi:hypothetical protein
VLYAGAAGVSQVALLVSVAFWTWLWGPLGLLMATPLTVCLVVLGKHVPGLEFVGTLMSDTPALAADYGYYQRLLARDQSEAADLIERHIETDTPRSVYDALLLPALNHAERDRLEERLSAEEETAVLDATRELLSDAAESIKRLNPAPIAPPDGPLPGPRQPLRVAGLRRQRHRRRARSRHARPSAGRSGNRRRDHCRALAGPGIGVARARARVLGGVLRRSPTEPAIEDALSRQAGPRRLARGADPGRALGTTDAGGREHTGAAGGGANHVASTLVETREYLGGLVEIPRIPVPETPGVPGQMSNRPRTARDESSRRIFDETAFRAAALRTSEPTA